MRYTLKRNINLSINYEKNCAIEEVNIEGEELVDYLYAILVHTTKGSLDPVMASNTPEIYLKNLQSGKLGNFSERYIITAKDNEKVIGILIGLPDLNEKENFHILTLAVLPSCRGKGFGKVLLGHCIDDLVGSKYTNAIIDVHEDNKPALKLYEKLGFIIS